MRNLLTRWAEREPERCKRVTTENLIIGKPDLEEIYLIDSAGRWRMVLSDVLGLDLEEDDLMRVGWAVQEATQARGWWLSLDYKGDWCCILYYHYNERTVENIRNVTLIGQKSSTEALLSAYLKALESER